jgi:hypothetical protein
MLHELIKLANSLDQEGLTKEADYLDLIIYKQSQIINPVTWWAAKGLAGGLSEFDEATGGRASEVLDYTQAIIDGVGLIPGAGELFDVANATIHALRGNKVNSILSMISTITGVGDLIGKGAKLLLHAIKTGLKTIKVGLQTYTISGLGKFLYEKISTVFPQIKQAVAWLDQKVGTNEFSDVWNNNMLPQIRSAAQPTATIA